MPPISGRWAAAGLVAAGIAFGLAGPAARGRDVSRPGAGRANLDFTVKDLNGQDVRLADFKGRPLLINFWATWCGPCKIEIPGLVELTEKYKKTGFTVVGISTDDTPEDLKAFASVYKMNYPILVGLGHDELMEAYEAELGIPVSWFVRRDGTIALKSEGAQTKAWFEERIKALF